MTLPKTWIDGEVLYAPDLNTNFTTVETTMNNMAIPIGAILPWAKTFRQVDSGTTDSTSAFKLIQTGQNFLTTVLVGNVVYNTTDKTFAYVTNVDNNQQLTLNTDIMVNGKAYVIYTTPALTSNFAECNGQTLVDAGSIFNGALMPALNGNSETTSLFLRGALFSGTTGGAAYVDHTHILPHIGSQMLQYGNVSGDYRNPTTGGASDTNNIPPYYEVVFIMRVK